MSRRVIREDSIGTIYSFESFLGKVECELVAVYNKGDGIKREDDIAVWNLVDGRGNVVGMFSWRDKKVGMVLVTDHGKLLGCEWYISYPNGSYKYVR